MYQASPFTENELAYQEASERTFQEFCREVDRLRDTRLTQDQFRRNEQAALDDYTAKINELRDFHNIDPRTNRTRAAIDPDSNFFRRQVAAGKCTEESYR